MLKAINALELINSLQVIIFHFQLLEHKLPLLAVFSQQYTDISNIDWDQHGQAWPSAK